MDNSASPTPTPLLGALRLQKLRGLFFSDEYGLILRLDDGRTLTMNMHTTPAVVPQNPAGKFVDGALPVKVAEVLRRVRWEDINVEADA